MIIHMLITLVCSKDEVCASSTNANIKFHHFLQCRVPSLHGRSMPLRFRLLDKALKSFNMASIQVI